MKKFIDKFPIIFSVAVFVITMPLIWGATYPLLYKLPFYFASAIKYTLTLLAVVAICFIVYRKIPFTLQYKGLFKGLFTFGLVGLICAVMAFVFSYDTPDVTPTAATVIGFILYNLAIAVSEEFLFRGVIFTRLLDSRQSKKGFIWAAIIISSVIFGLRHLLNLVATPNVIFTTVGQVMFTFMAGFYLCAVYLRTRNIWVCIIIHFLEDFFTGFWAMVSSSAAIASTVDGTVASMFLLVGVHSVYVIFGVLMLKSKKWQYEPLFEVENNNSRAENETRESLSEMPLKKLWKLFPIVLAEHNPNWREWYLEEAAALKTILPNHVELHHVGSTAVDGIKAKPIIDILVVVKSLEELRETATILRDNGYIVMSESENRISLNKGYTESGYAERVFHLHVRLDNDIDEIYFRDYLIAHKTVAEEYENLKTNLCKKYAHNRDAYTTAKTDFVKKYTDLAKG